MENQIPERPQMTNTTLRSTTLSSQSKPLPGTMRREASPRGLQFDRHFSAPGVHPFDEIAWCTRTAEIANEKGEIFFKQADVQVPETWSQMATNVVVSKYFRGTLGTSKRETSVRQLISRVADTIADWGQADGYFADSEACEIFRHELIAILLNQYAAFNSPVWFNVGVEARPQCSACFILSVDDSMQSLLELQRAEAMIFKYGSGAGSNLSAIRSSKEGLSGGGIASGPVSFMRGFDAWAGTIKSGGKTRRAAKMQILDVNHPDIEEFVNAKRIEEEKAWALIEEGYAGGFNVMGGAYDSVFFQNSNLSVRVTDDFMEAALAGKTFPVTRRTDGTPCGEIDARKVLQDIAHGTHVCGDPGLQFDTTINNWHTCANSGRINASNPCSEYMHLDDSACNLASINLLKFLRDDDSFDFKGFKHTVDILITAQDILVDRASYPTEKIEANAHAYRQLGLGFANLGALLMSKGMQYDADEGRALAGTLMALLCGEAYLQSARIAAELGPFSGFEENREPMLHVIGKHTANTDELPIYLSTEPLRKEAQRVWHQALERGECSGFRNSQATVLAPTGTIAFLMDCDTTGIEPDIALVKYKKLVGGGMLKIVNQSVPRALSGLGYDDKQVKDICSYIDEHDTIEGAPGLKPEHLAVFDCAFKPLNGERSIHYLGHLKMMAACQPFVSGAISKTVNLPEKATVEDIFDTYVAAWQMGIKAVAIYRDNSKRSQPLGTGRKAEQIAAAPVLEQGRRRLPAERQAITHKFSIAGHEGYLTVGLFEDGTPGEIFLVMAKEGSTLSGVMDAFATSVSMALQYGVPLAVFVKKFSHMRFEPAGMTGHQQIPMAKSILDYIFRWLALKFMSPEDQRALGILPLSEVEHKAEETSTGGDQAARKKPSLKANGHNGHAKPASSATLTFELSDDAPPCHVCGSSLMVRQGACYRCLNCGSQGGCG